MKHFEGYKANSLASIFPDSYNLSCIPIHVQAVNKNLQYLYLFKTTGISCLLAVEL